MWEIEFTDEFEQWWDSLTEDEQDAVGPGGDHAYEGGAGIEAALR